MRVELLYFEGCPHVEPTRMRLQQVLHRLAPDAVLQEICVDSEAGAWQVDFWGSPSVRVGGVDLEGQQGRPVGLACRMYGQQGVPPEWLIEAAVLRAMRPRHILFLCVANSARSQMAEGIARFLAPPGVRISSAGSLPSMVRREAIAVLREIGIDISKQRSKGIDAIDRETVDAVVTLCAEEVCPVFPGPVRKLHWGFADPAAAGGGDEAHLDAFRVTRDGLYQRLVPLLSDRHGRP